MTVEIRGRMVITPNIKEIKKARKILDKMSRDLEGLAGDLDRSGDRTVANQALIAAQTVESARKALATFIVAAELAAEQAKELAAPKHPTCAPGECLCVIKGKRAVCRICGDVKRIVERAEKADRYTHTDNEACECEACRKAEMGDYPDPDDEDEDDAQG